MAQTKSLEPRHAEFLEQTHYLLQPAEREVWDQLSENYQRDAFIRRFWREHDLSPRRRATSSRRPSSRTWSRLGSATTI